LHRLIDIHPCENRISISWFLFFGGRNERLYELFGWRITMGDYTGVRRWLADTTSQQCLG
jgi:hypothetical protein